MKNVIIGMILGFLPTLLVAETNVSNKGRNFTITGKEVVIINGKVISGKISENMIKGSGVIKTETREVDEFYGLNLSCSADVKITYGETPRLDIIADDTILPIVSTEVTDGVLNISTNESYSTQNNIIVKIQVPMIQELSIQGSGDIDMDSVTKDTLSLSISGSGNIDATGSVVNLMANVSGSGDLQLKKLKATHCNLMINGSGDAIVSVSERLDAAINGSGDIYYYGKPKKVSSKVNGSGEVHSKSL